MSSSHSLVRSASWRISAWYTFLIICLAIITIRLFIIQVIQHGQYQKAASLSQYKERVLTAERGAIEAYNGEQVVPLVLNEKKYTLYVDPKYIVSPERDAATLQKLVGGEVGDIQAKMLSESRYQIISKKLDKETTQKINDLGLKGVVTREEAYRTYPQGSMAAQVLGFVNDEGVGSYGVEQYLDETLRGKPGLLKAVVDASGVPLPANRENVAIDPEQGSRVRLTIDVGIQQKTEEILKQGLDNAKSVSGSVIVIDPNTGAVKAMANYPTYNPAEFFKVEAKDHNVFNNAIVSSPMEVGSIMKPLTIAAALDQGVIGQNWSYFDPGKLVVDEATIKNVTPNYGQTSLENVLLKSLNTGAVTVLAQMGGGAVNEQARARWYDYLTNRYHFGQRTNIEQGYDQDGYVPLPTDGFGLDIQYANMAFGQGINVTLLQMASAFSSVVNGGNYYQPYLVESVNNQPSPRPAGQKVLTPESSTIVSGILRRVLEQSNPSAARRGYIVGGKTGTAQIPNPAGGYFPEDKINGTYAGYVGGDKPQYVVVVRVNEPGISGFAGSRAAAPLFSSIANMLIDGSVIEPSGL